MSDRTEPAVKLKPTIKDVAEDSGVSIATVSAVVHGAEWVTAKTRARVQRSIKALGYRPNHVARSLKTRKSHTVGVIVADALSPFFVGVFRSLGLTLRKHERSLVLCDAEQTYNLGRAHLRNLLEKQVDAVVLVGDAVAPDPIHEAFSQAAAMPIVVVGRDCGVPGVHTLLVDEEAAGYEATAHLKKGGARRIAMIRAPRDRTACFDGYRRAVAEAGAPFDPTLVVDAESHPRAGQHAMRRLLDLPEPPDAVFVSSDLIALGAVQALLETGHRVPDDVSVVGFGDNPASAHTYPSLSTVALPAREVGEAAAHLILDPPPLDPEAAPRHRAFPAVLVPRRSSER